MKRWQVLILIMMVGLVILLFLGVAMLVLANKSLLLGSTEAVAGQPVMEDGIEVVINTPEPTPTATATPTPTSTLTPTSTNTPAPTLTPTRVVNDTVTPTASKTPTPTKTPEFTSTPVPSSSGASPSGGIRRPTGPTATPTSMYPFKMVQGPIVFTTTNHFLMVLVSVTQGNAPAPGYKLVGTHSPTGMQWESPPACPDLCKASGPEAIYDEDGKKVKTFSVQKGNLAFEAPVYETGTWSLMLVDSRGQQMSAVFQITLDSQKKQWFFYQFNR